MQFIWNTIKNNDIYIEKLIIFVSACFFYGAHQIFEDFAEKIGFNYCSNFISMYLYEILGYINNSTSEIYKLDTSNKKSSKEGCFYMNHVILKNFFSKYVNPDKIIEYRDKKGRNLLSLCIINGTEESILYMLEMFFKKELDPNSVSKRLEELSIKDMDNMNILDYSITKKSIFVTEYLKRIKSQPGLPEVKITNLKTAVKNKEVLESEAIFLNLLKKKFDLYENDEDIAYKVNDSFTEADKKTVEFSIDYLKNLSNSENNEFRFQDFPNIKFEYIKTEAQLKKVAEILEKQKIIGLDLEFAYGNLLNSVNAEENLVTIAASIQISTIQENFFVDCIVLHNLISKY